jgi:membrane-associated phospholipid phosphatase
MILTSILQQLEQMDRQLFHHVNSDWTNSLFDTLMPLVRDKLFWAPLYLFVILFMLYNGGKNALWWVIGMVCTLALTDLTGNYAFKKVFERLRPCQDTDLGFQVRLLLNTCSYGYSFISNHAANHFGLATFFFITLRPWLKSTAWIAFVWAGLIAYAQVYVGVHYPLDVLAGSAVGLIWGYFMGTAFNKRYGFVIFGN